MHAASSLLQAAFLCHSDLLDLSDWAASPYLLVEFLLSVFRLLSDLLAWMWMISSCKRGIGWAQVPFTLTSSSSSWSKYFLFFEKSNPPFFYAIYVEFCVRLVRIRLVLEFLTMVSLCTRDLEPCNDILLCSCVVFVLLHYTPEGILSSSAFLCVVFYFHSVLVSMCLGVENGSILLCLDWDLVLSRHCESGFCGMVITRFLVPSGIMLLPACISVFHQG